MTFDLCEAQQNARELKTPQDLYLLWEHVLALKEKGLVGQYEVDEMKDVIFPALKKASILQKDLNEVFMPATSPGEWHEP